MIAVYFHIQLKDFEANTENEDSYSAGFVSDDLLYSLVDFHKVADYLFLSAIDDELHVRDGKCFRVHHLLLSSLSEVGG